MRERVTGEGGETRGRERDERERERERRNEKDARTKSQILK
jgi:hypothetical protein